MPVTWFYVREMHESAHMSTSSETFILRSLCCCSNRYIFSVTLNLRGLATAALRLFSVERREFDNVCLSKAITKTYASI